LRCDGCAIYRTSHQRIDRCPHQWFNDHPREAEKKTREALARYPDICAVYITTANSLPVLKALAGTKYLGRVWVVTTDLFPNLIPYIRSGDVLATVYQRPQTQGRIAFEALYHYLTERRMPPPRYALPPHLILQSNLDLFLEYLQPDSDDLSISGLAPETSDTGARDLKPIFS
jgi:ABC-type sugar transport system substrate-binding protein